ncbi:PAS domain S-box protein [Natronomonas halophila]|uniref:PAS domain S-box protein n=1 Tax=Natronomonas halophila TaxID=2747817 RepID=UPI0015B704C5|nr:PAS domain S-box protein [Natronomonas halophila]QLD86209.1 PAS domain S-box protein [Natronomonas halophila]
MDPSDVPPPASNAGRDSRAHDEFSIALGIENRRNRKLLTDLLSDFETTEATAPIPDGTDLCLVDTDGFAALQDAISDWKDAERPATAPVLLLTTSTAEEAWQRYGDTVGDLLDGIQPIPAPKRAIRARVDNLLETRSHSLVSRARQRELELYKRAMDDAGIGITIADATDPEQPLIYVNEGFVDITGYSREDVIGRNCRFLQGPDTDEATVQRIREGLDAEEPISVDIRNYRADGDLFWNALNITPVTDESGSVTHFLGFQQDVTDRKQREQLLEQYEQILQSVDDPVFVLDRTGRVVDTNPAAEEAFVSDGADSADTPVADLFDIDSADAFRAAIEALGDGERSQTREITADTKGRRSVYQFRFQRVTIATDEPVDRIIAIGRDITRIREYQDRLTVLDRILRHNLRNKLNVVTGQSQFLEENADRLPLADVREIASAIDTAASDLLELADAARQFNRNIDPDRASSTVADVTDLVRDVVAEVRADRPDVSLDMDASSSVTATCPSTIRLCIERLVANAVEYADEQDPRVRITVEDDGVEWVELAVADNGPGFPDVERRVLTSGSETSLEHVQGLSLWLVRWAVTNVGGRLEIRDRPDGGSVVALLLPRVDRPVGV